MVDSMSKPQDLRSGLTCRSQTILVVDDESGVRELVCRILRLRGYQVLEADRGIEALRLFQEYADTIHLLLTDILMPDMNGPALAEQVQALRPCTKVLYMSGYPDMACFPHLGSQTGPAFIQKPFVLDVLVQKVREVLGTA
jgi:DNA-binding NtrC family response regulator